MVRERLQGREGRPGRKVKSNDTIEREYRESQERSDERRRQKSPPRLVTVILSVMLSASLAVLFFMCLVALDVVRLKF
jgi:hypothetical protein